MYQYAAQMQHQTVNFRRRYRVLLVAGVVLLALSVVFGVMTFTGRAFQGRTYDSFAHAMSNNVASAISVSNRLDSTSNSTVSQRLGMIRQYVYGMEQINRMSIQLFGEAKGRFVPDSGINKLYDDLNEYEKLVQSGKNSMVDIRELLIRDLELVQGFVNGDLVN